MTHISLSAFAVPLARLPLDGDALRREAGTGSRGCCRALEAQKNGRLRFSTVDFSAELTVIDPGKFDKALLDGIGHAKAFGCGLLLLRRIS